MVNPREAARLRRCSISCSCLLAIIMWCHVICWERVGDIRKTNSKDGLTNKRRRRLYAYLLTNSYGPMFFFGSHYSFQCKPTVTSYDPATSCTLLPPATPLPPATTYDGSTPITGTQSKRWFHKNIWVWGSLRIDWALWWLKYGWADGKPCFPHPMVVCTGPLVETEYVPRRWEVVYLW